MEYQFLAGVVAKTVLAKAGSFDVFNTEKFLVMEDVVVGLKVNCQPFFSNSQGDDYIRKPIPLI